MQIVANVPNSLYANLSKIKNGSIASGRILDCVKNGTPLPKGHGRLIDADEVDDAIYKCFDGIQFYDGTGYDIYLNSKESIDEIPTIIEADKEKEE